MYSYSALSHGDTVRTLIIDTYVGSSFSRMYVSTSK